MAFKVKYNGNGNTSGQVPVDNNSYNAGEIVQVLGPTDATDQGYPTPKAGQTAGDKLARNGDVFAYWDTMANGTGTHLYWPQGGASFTITSNVTIYAQWFTKDGLSNGGVKPHYDFAYDRALQNSPSNPAGPEPDRTNQLIADCEDDYQIMSDWFGGMITLERVATVPLPTSISIRDGGAAVGGTKIVLCQGEAPVSSLRLSLVAEVTEIFMHAQKKGWGFVKDKTNEESDGEALSLFLTMQFAVLRGFADPYSFSGTANTWLNSSLPTSNPNSTRYYVDVAPAGYDYGSRSDYVNVILPWHGNGPGTGCSILFLYYLNHQLGFTIPQIIAAAPGFTNGVLNSTGTLRGVYQNLTGDTGDPFPFFSQLLDTVFPSNAVASIPEPNQDDPFPLALMSFWVDKSTFGKDEVQDVINTGGGKWSKAFWLVIEGFSKNSFNSLGVTIPAPTGTFANLNGLSMSQNPDIDFENAANPQAPQRIRIPFDITFTNASIASFPASGNATYDLNASLTVGGNKVPGSDASTQFELVAGSDPYFTNIDPNQNNVWYLSQDLRVFTATPGKTNVPVQGGPSFPGDNVEGAYSYIRSLLTWLNSTYNDPSGTDPFNTLLPGQGGALTGDSSVTPLTVDFSNFFSPQLYNNYNFAVARVRLRGLPNSTVANNVRVFFRLWSSETADTDFQADTYPSTSDDSRPTVGADHRTLPFFAASDQSDYNTGASNDFNIQLSTGDYIWAYFGCFLNVYDVNNVVDGKPVQAWLNGTHHCIVAQIAYSGTPIGFGDTPVSSDKLAQRNLQITLSDNPGGPETHRIPQTIDVRPSANSSASAYPDELMIDWGSIPAGSVASIYWPQVLASDVIAMAAQLYSTHTLSASDANTIQCKVNGGVTYIPILPGGSESFAGLFTVDLPTTVVTGQEFNVVVRRISSRTAPPPVVINTPPTHSLPSNIGSVAKKAKDKVKAAKPSGQAGTLSKMPAGSWRYVVGTFQVKIPVSDGTTILPQEQNTLAIMKWRLQQMAPANRWYPVLQRYISYISARVAGLGGDPNAIPPSLSGAPTPFIGEKEAKSYTGKVCEVIYDCFGDFEGFVLESCCESQSFKSCEKGIGEFVLRACRERMVVTVYVGPPSRNRIQKIVIRCC